MPTWQDICRRTKLNCMKNVENWHGHFISFTAEVNPWLKARGWDRLYAKEKLVFLLVLHWFSTKNWSNFINNFILCIVFLRGRGPWPPPPPPKFYHCACCAASCPWEAPHHSPSDEGVDIATNETREDHFEIDLTRGSEHPSKQIGLR